MKRLVAWSLLAIVAVSTITQCLHWPSAHALSANNGDGLMMYGENAIATPRLRTYDGTANNFSSETNTVAGAAPIDAVVKTSPNKQEAIAAYVSAGGILRVLCYDGTTWSNEWNVTVGGTGTTSRFDVVYEATSGDAMVVYSTNTPATNELAYRTKAGANGCGTAQWSAASTIDAIRTSGTVLWVRLEASLAASSNAIGLAWSDDANDLSGMEWTGASWAIAEPTSAMETDLERVSAAGDVIAFDLAFENVTGNLMVVWGASDALAACTVASSCMEYARYTTSWAFSAVPTVADEATSIDISSNPNTNEIIAASIGNRASDLSAAYWSGSAWTGSADRDTDCSLPIAGTKMVATGWVISSGGTRSIITYADATAPATNISYHIGNGATFSVGTDFTPSPTPGAFRWLDIQTDPIYKDRLMLTFSDANSDLFAKRLTFINTTFAWTNSDGAALEATLPSATMFPFSFAYWRYAPPPASAAGDGQVIYPETSFFTPRNRQFYGSNELWSAEANVPTAGAANQGSIVRASPTRNEMIAAVTTSTTINVYRWDGTTWSAEWSVAVGSLIHTPRITITYEELSGDAVVIYSTNASATNEMAYRVWNGTSWTTATNLDAVRTSGQVAYVTAKTRPGTDEIAVVWADGNRDLSANYWDGSSWAGEPAALLENDLIQIEGTSTSIEGPVMDLAFEAQSGKLMIGWGNNVSTNFKYVLRSAGGAGSWGSTVSPSEFTQTAEIMRLESRPNSNYIAYINNTNWSYPANVTSYKAQAAIWNGSAWTVSSAFDATAALDGQHDVAAAWLSSGGASRAVFTFDATGTTGIDYFTYDPSTNNFSTPTTYSTTPTPTNVDDVAHRLYTNPYDPDEAISFVIDNSKDIFTKKVSFDGANVSWSSLEPGGVIMESNVLNSTIMPGWQLDFDYRRDFSFGSLTADIVDSGGSSVASPSLTMTNATVSNSCQTTTGTFGSSSQKLRVANTTVTPGWTLTMAATGGAISNWTSGTASYDFNDSSGSPAGCSDGGDADSLAGQLTVTPTGSTITPQGGCSATGISLGSANPFAQGTTDNITLATASGSTQTNCYWDITGIGLSQKIPGFIPAGSYTMNVTITTTAN